jgi:nucleoside-diphosphate-sugar epimerase
MFVNNQGYLKQIETAASLKIDWERFKGKAFFITGATGLIGVFLIDVLMFASEKYGLGVAVYGAGRNRKSAEHRLHRHIGNERFRFIEQDINEPVKLDVNCDYIIHGASATHPLQYSSDPVGTITANVIGLRNVLEFAAGGNNNARVMFLSSVEIYGENRGDAERFDESYCGYIDCNTLRAGYPESKRAGEALCQAYIKAKNLDIVIPRLSRVYGPTMSESDSKAVAQFIKKALNGEDIVLKSKGDQLFSYTYAADAVCAILYILLYGKRGEAYNVSDEKSEITLKDLAQTLADIAGTKVIFELPSETDSAGYSKATKALLDNGKLKGLGWESGYDIRTGLGLTVKILSEA